MLADARQYFAEGQLDRAEELCRGVLSDDPRNAEALQLAALVAHQRGQPNLAVELLQQALAVDVRQAQFHYNLGYVYQTGGKIEEAVASYRAAVELDPHSSGAHNNLGYALLQLGWLDEAVSSLNVALHLNPAYAEAHNNLGLTFAARGEADRAVESYRRAVRLKPDLAEAHFNLGMVLASLGRNHEAAGCYRRASEIRGPHAETEVRLARTLNQFGSRETLEALERAARLMPLDASLADELGNAYARANRFEEALEQYRNSVRLKPDCAAFMNNLGHGLRISGRLDEAIEIFTRVLALSPNVAEAHANLGRIWAERRLYGEATRAFQQALEIDPRNAGAHCALGNLLKEQGCGEEAASEYQAALSCQPNDAATHQLLGNLYTELRRYADAEHSYRQAIQLEPADAVTRSNLANALNIMGRPQEAEAECRLAMALRPDFADAHHNRGIALMALGRHDEALAERCEALRLKPDYPEARLCHALDLLRQGCFEDGWLEYESRWKLKMNCKPAFTRPEWDGSPLVGRTILLYAEQGLGDTIQFIRYAPLVQKCGARVVVQCQKPLVELIRTAPGIDQLLGAGDSLPPFDVQLPLVSLPRLVRTTMDTIPRDVPYLSANETLVEQWKSEMAGTSGFKIGIAWQGNRGFIGDSLRSVPLRHFEHLAGVPGVRLYSLQKGDGREQLAEIADRFEVVDLADRLDVSNGAFMDTAAVIRNLDLVITSDSAIAHLAGALGSGVWMALQLAADWRWLERREDSPWYPTMRIFRQRSLNGWDDVFQTLAAEVEREMASRGVTFGVVEWPSVRVPPGPSPAAPQHRPPTIQPEGAAAPPVSVSIVTPWHNHPELIPDYERAVRGAHVVIVDNGSDPGAAAELRAMVERLSGVYLRNEHNAGFAAANNQGFSLAEGKIVVFLNNDVAGGPAFLQAVRRDVQPGELVGPQIGSQTVWGLSVPYVVGWCVAARREVFQQLEGWDAAAYADPLWEDNDLSLRAIEAGFKLRSCSWPIHHKAGTSLGAMLFWGDVYERNRATFATSVEKVYRRMKAAETLAPPQRPAALSKSIQASRNLELPAGTTEPANTIFSAARAKKSG
jgi:tetratricopeptide (TPR) repeat protein